MAFALAQTIPLRMAIIQDNLNIDAPTQGTITVSGSGWSNIKDVEKRLNWIGGILYLPQYDGHHVRVVDELVHKNYLIIQQNDAKDEQHFMAQFKEREKLDSNNTWFLNWHRILKLSKEKQDEQIDDWWQRYIHDRTISNDKKVKLKQENTKMFADYCRMLYQAAYLVHFSKIDANLVGRGEI